MNQMPGQGSGFPGQFGEMANIAKTGMEAGMEIMADLAAKGKDAMSNFGSRRRRSSEKQ